MNDPIDPLDHAPAPALPLLPSGILPPAIALVRWMEAVTPSRVVVAAMPPLNGSLPDLLRLGGVEALETPMLPQPGFRWEGVGGGRLDAVETDQEAEPDLFHHGELPAAEPIWADDQGSLALLDLARLEDATSCLGVGHGAAWDQVLTALGAGVPPRVPPMLRQAQGDHLGAWNPLPIERDLVVSLGGIGKPWGVRDEQGRTFPAQVVEGVTGEEVLTSLRLGAFQCVTLEALEDPVEDSAWEVEPTVLDNGIVRAELDALGQVTRLCWDGVFAELTGPAVAPRIDGRLLGGTATVTVVESGPVRARVSVRRTAGEGTLLITYTLHAHEDCLRITASWTGEGDLALAHPTGHRGSRLIAAGELSRVALNQSRSVVTPPMEPLAGVRWAALGDAAGRGLAVVAGRPLVIEAEGGELRVLGSTGITYALAAARRRPGALNLGTLAQTLGLPGRRYTGGEPLTAPFRLGDPGGLVPLHARKPAGWNGELLLVDQSGARGKAFLQPLRKFTEAWRVDARGEPIARLTISKEGDGIDLDHGPHDVFIVRWK